MVQGQVIFNVQTEDKNLNQNFKILNSKSKIFDQCIFALMLNFFSRCAAGKLFHFFITMTAC